MINLFISGTVSEPVPRAGLGRAAGRSTGMNCSGQYSRRSSEDSTTDEASLPANVREMRVREENVSFMSPFKGPPPFSLICSLISHPSSDVKLTDSKTDTGSNTVLHPHQTLHTQCTTILLHVSPCCYLANRLVVVRWWL